MPTPEEALKAFWDSADAYDRNVQADNYGLDPELQKHLTTIYGNVSKLNKSTIDNLKNTWSKNPQFIINTAQQKLETPVNIKQDQFDSPNFALKDTGLNPLDKSKGPIQLFSGGNGVRAAQQWLKENNYGNIIDDNMYGAKTDAAINTALQDKNLDLSIRNQLTALQEQYKGKWVPQKQKIVNQYTTNTQPIEVATPDLIQTTKGQTFGRGIPSITNTTTQNPPTQVTNPNISQYNIVGNSNGYYSDHTMEQDFQKLFNQAIGNKFNISPSNRLYREQLELLKQYPGYNEAWLNFQNQYELSPAHWGLAKLFENKWKQKSQPQKKQQGGNLNNMNQQEILKKAFINYLVQVTGAKTEQDLAKLGQDQIKQLYQQFTTGIQDGSIEVSQDGQVNVKGRKAALGAKLSYFNKLQGKCPEGEQLVTFKIGGRMCTACQKGNKVEKKQTMNQNTNQQPKKLDPEKTPVLPGGKYPSYWTADDRIKWERKYGQKDEGAAVSPPPRKNQLGAALQLLLNKNR